MNLGGDPQHWGLYTVLTRRPSGWVVICFFELSQDHQHLLGGGATFKTGVLTRFLQRVMQSVLTRFWRKFRGRPSTRGSYTDILTAYMQWFLHGFFRKIRLRRVLALGVALGQCRVVYADSCENIGGKLLYIFTIRNFRDIPKNTIIM